MPRTALTVAEDAFRLLVCEPAPLAFDGAVGVVLPGPTHLAARLSSATRNRPTTSTPNCSPRSCTRCAATTFRHRGSGYGCHITCVCG